jgi:hypothetical protein
MSKLLIISEKPAVSFWVRLGRRIIKSRNYKIEDHLEMMSFVNYQKPELIYFELGQDIEADNINDFLRKVNSYPVSVVVLEATPFKINLFSMLFPLNFLERIFPPRKALS